MQFLNSLLRLLDEARGYSTGAVLGEGGYARGGTTGLMVWTEQKTAEFPQVQFLDVFVQTVLKLVMIPQLQFSDKDVDMPVILGSRRAENCELFTVAVPGRC